MATFESSISITDRSTRVRLSRLRTSSAMDAKPDPPRAIDLLEEDDEFEEFETEGAWQTSKSRTSHGWKRTWNLPDEVFANALRSSATAWWRICHLRISAFGVLVTCGTCRLGSQGRRSGGRAAVGRRLGRSRCRRRLLQATAG